jgi:hypothetical protein
VTAHVRSDHAAAAAAKAAALKPRLPRVLQLKLGPSRARPAKAEPAILGPSRLVPTRAVLLSPVDLKPVDLKPVDLKIVAHAVKLQIPADHLMMTVAVNLAAAASGRMTPHWASAMMCQPSLQWSAPRVGTRHQPNQSAHALVA